MSWQTTHRYIIVPGLRNSGPGHWQTHWEQLLRATRVEQDDWATADLERWSARVVAAVNPDPRPAILIAHSFGCLASVHALRRIAPRVKGLLLVAPAAPEKFQITQRLPQGPIGVPSLLVGSQTDPWLTSGRARALAATWGSDFVNLGDAGHVNADSGHARWEEGLRLLERLQAPAAPRRINTVAERSSRLAAKIRTRAGTAAFAW